MSTPLRLFICYARSDNGAPHHWLDRIKKILHLVAHIKLVEVDADTEIRPGADWDAYIHQALDQADVVVLLVSVDFLASQYVREHELPKVLLDHHERGVTILPVLLSPFPESAMEVHYEDAAGQPQTFNLSRLQAAVGTPERTLEDMLDNSAEWKRALNKLADEVARLAKGRRPLTPRPVVQVPSTNIVLPPQPSLVLPPVYQGIERPIWANHDFGEDRYGVWAEFQVEGVVQRCRWIKGGTFLMGSPNNEPGRNKNEGPQHSVHLSGFWLADTACTQALWRAVMGNNLVQLTDDELNPVERVSWFDGEAFFIRLNQQLRGLAAGFPTEAQWEYACRAGTSGPFSFGTTITAKQVNFDGESRYADSALNMYQEKPVAVASLPANPWGLYEMHGNVWEWCADWFAPYGPEPLTDPEGPSQGTERVLRGGSWIGDEWSVRSACRHYDNPFNRFYLIGLRLSPGRQAAVGPSGCVVSR